MDRMKRSLSGRISSLRTRIQATATLLSNFFLTNIPQGRIYQGSFKRVCVPGLNCYSCPAATGACPIGAMQAVSGSVKFSISFYLIGFLMIVGAVFGRFICGFLCPFGWFQELLHKIPSRKLSTSRLKPLRFFKYAVLLVAVIILPAVLKNEIGLGDPFFCKYICPQGVLEGAIPLAISNSNIRSALGNLFVWKSCILITVILLSILFYRPFCKWLCPLGAFYALFNRISWVNMETDSSRCISCGRCADVCGMDVDITRSPGHTECIRCGICITNCPTKAISYTLPFRNRREGSQAQSETDINS